MTGTLMGMIGWGLLGSVPVIVLGFAVVLLTRRLSVAASTVVMVLVPTLATLSGVFVASGFMVTTELTQLLELIGVVAVVTVPSAVVLARLQSRRTVWERQARERERAAEHKRRELVAWISHDLRTPVAGIRAQAELLTDAIVSEPDEVAQTARAIEATSVRLQTMVDDLFQMSRISAGALRLTLEPLDLREIADEVVAAQRVPAERAGIGLRWDAPAEPVEVTGDARETSRVLHNLITNAIAHTPYGGTVTVGVSLDTSNGAGVLSVQDTGTGVAAADRAEIFEVGFRGGAARTRAGDGGAGLGLAIARGLVEAQHGRIELADSAVGCRFEVRLPAASPSTTDLIARSEPATTRRGTSHERSWLSGGDGEISPAEARPRSGPAPAPARSVR